MRSGETGMLMTPPLVPRLRIVWMGTHPHQYNGYSKVCFQLARALHAHHGHEIDLHLFGFQNNFHDVDHVTLRRLHPEVHVFDAASRENPRAQGFGFDQVCDYMTMVRPDVVFVYNDPGIISNVLAQLDKLPPSVRNSFRFVPYFDQVYPSHRNDVINMLNTRVDAAVLFTPGWETCAQRQGVKVPTHFMRHGFDPEVYFPVPRQLARRMFQFPSDDFLVLNLNRNVPRKRWDTTMMAWAEVVMRYLRDAPASGPARSSPRLIVAAEANGSWNLTEMFERELQKRGLTLVQGMRHVTFMSLPQRMSDAMINALYNATDVGINTCDGEGFGMCNFEHAGVGVPQIVPRVGGFLDFFSDDCATLVDPCATFYIDATRGEAGGEAVMCNSSDFADAIMRYYNNPALRARHGQQARNRIAGSTLYHWSTSATKLRDIAFAVCNMQAPDPTRRDCAAASQDVAPSVQDLMTALSRKDSTR